MNRTWKTALAFALAMFLAAPCHASEADSSPIKIRGVGGANLGGTWTVGLTGVGKLINDRYPGSTMDILIGASVSNPLRLENNSGDLTLTQGINTFTGPRGQEPYKKPLNNLAAIGNVHDTSRMQVIVAADLPAESLDAIVAKKLPVRLDCGAKGTLHYMLGRMYLAEMGVTLDDIEKWGGKVTVIPDSEKVSAFQDGVINAQFVLGPGEQADKLELVRSCRVKWLPVSEKVLKAVSEKTGLKVGFVPGSFYGGAVGRDVSCLIDTTVFLVRKNLPDDVVYKITRSICEGYKELHAVQPIWSTLNPQDMPRDLILPLHPGAEKYYREAGIL